MNSRGLLWLLIGSGFLAAAPARAQNSPSIRFAEPVTLALKSGAAEFDAFGRRFTLALTANERVLGKLSSAEKNSLARYRLLRGSLAGVPGSWVRITETPQGPEGALWDGQDFYALTRYDNIAPYLTTPLDAAPGQTVVYRLSDARDALPANFCGAQAGHVAADPTALDQYKSLVTEIQSAGMIYPSTTRQIEISLIADTAFQEAEGSDPTAAMLARLNIVEGIFSEQVGLLVLAGELRLMPADSDPFTSTRPTTLLEQVGAYRSATAAVRAHGLAHLMTGKDLDGTTAGIAYVRTVCERERGVSLSQRSFGTTISALVMAHELGHNLGASHDGETGSPCASTPAGFIMAPSVTGFATFSQCSLDTLKPVIAAASCITPAEFADVALEAGISSWAGEGGVPISVPFTVRSAGTVAAENAELSITLPPSATLHLTAASAEQGRCEVQDNSAVCSLGTLAPGSSVAVSVTALSSMATSITVQARTTASNDRLTSNNNRVVSVSIRSGVDAALSVAASAADIAVGAVFEVFADLTSLRAQAVRNATISLNLNQPVSSASVPGGSCSVQGSSVSCTVAEIASGATRRVTLRATATNAGPLFASGSVSTEGDGNLANNSASATAWIQAARDLELIAPESQLELPVGVVDELVFRVRSRGSDSVPAAELLLTLPAALRVDGLTAAAGDCANSSALVWRCPLGALAPGDVQTVTLRLHATAPTSGVISAVANADQDGYPANNSASLTLRIDHRVDLGMGLASGGAGVEDGLIEGQVAVTSTGRQSAVGGTVDLQLPAAGRSTYAALHSGVACQLLAADLARCALPEMPRGATLYVDYGAVFEEPGHYDIRFAVAAAGDSHADNDVLVRPMVVRPYLDASLGGVLELPGVFGEQRRTVTLMLRTDRRGLASARVSATHALPALRVDAITAAGATCRLDADLGGICEFADLPAQAAVPVTVTYLSEEGSWIVEPAVRVSTPGDVDSGNDTVRGRVETLGSTDLALQVDASMGGPRATPLNFPVIEVINGAHRALTPRLDVTLPAGILIEQVSASDGICSGAAPLRCDFETLEPHARVTVSIRVRASTAGRFVSSVAVTALNDVDPSNNQREVGLEIGGDIQNSKGPRGGGGRLDALLLLLLATLLATKWGHSTFSCNNRASRVHTDPPDCYKKTLNVPFPHHASEFDTNATCVPSGDHDGTLMVPWPPYT